MKLRAPFIVQLAVRQKDMLWFQVGAYAPNGYPGYWFSSVFGIPRPRKAVQ